MKNASYLIGNSSAGIRESAYYGVPAVNVGSRQLGRHSNPLIVDADNSVDSILDAIKKIPGLNRIPVYNFGRGDSCNKFKSILDHEVEWPIPTDKQFVDINFGESK
jgi:UDP-N-acetylglucosamine 2-epimerase (hydrolysing)